VRGRRAWLVCCGVATIAVVFLLSSAVGLSLASGRPANYANPSVSTAQSAAGRLRVTIRVPAHVEITLASIVVNVKSGVRMPARLRLVLEKPAAVPKAVVAVGGMKRVPNKRSFVGLVAVITPRKHPRTLDVVAGPPPSRPAPIADDGGLALNIIFEAIYTGFQPTHTLLEQPGFDAVYGVTHVVPFPKFHPPPGFQEAIPELSEIDKLNGELVKDYSASFVLNKTVELTADELKHASMRQLDEIIEQIERAIDDDLNGDGIAGLEPAKPPPPPPPPPPPALFKYHFEGLTDQFTTAPPQNVTVKETFYGDHCGPDPLNGIWTITVSDFPFPGSPFSEENNFALTNPFTANKTSTFLGSDPNTILGASTSTLQLVPGASPQMILKVTLTGGDNGLSYPGPTQVPVTVTPATSCP
jgi:hypothetical protein